MDDDTKLGITALRCSAACLCVLILAIAGNCSYQTHLAAEAMTFEGNAPIAVGCALGQIAASTAECGITAAQQEDSP